MRPAHFLEHIEYTEYARRVGLFVLHSAIEVIEGFIERGLPYSISINLSPSHFLSGLFQADITEALADCLPEVRSRLILEILETTALDDADTVIGNLEVCRNLGLDISLDDFGTGYSSLSYFRKLPAQEIKVDQSFVQDMLKCEDDSMIVEAVLSLSHSFKRRTVGEGIETVEVEARLIDLGCETGQGFLYSRPVPLSEALEWAKDFIWGSHHSVD